MAVYLVNSYIQNPELLTESDQKTLIALRDIFNQELIDKTIGQVRKRLETILTEPEDFFEAIVYFKPKKFKDGQNIFRPLHTAALTDQIAIISMLQVLVYDEDSEGKLIPSELSRLIPAHFYGNRIAYTGDELFRPWQKQYQEYTQKANELFYQYSKTKEYRYEVSLDLENFFPSIDPQILYNFICSNLPLRLKEDEVIKIILKKLLIFKLSKLERTENRWYYQQEYYTEESINYVKGLPQGLPHTYFLANLFMLMVEKEYKTAFPGHALFYVDDSVIFTNGKNGNLDFEIFIELVNELNEDIKQTEAMWKAKEDNVFFPKDYPYEIMNYGVHVHEPNQDGSSKSAYSDIDGVIANSGELYLHGLSRETSKVGQDMRTEFSDDESGMTLERVQAILKTIELEIDRIRKKLELKQENYLNKLIRYRKFFSYRKIVLSYQGNGDINALKDEIIKDIILRENDQEIEKFYEKYTDDILAAKIQFVLKRMADTGEITCDLKESIHSLISMIYGENAEHAYLDKIYAPYLDGQVEFQIIDPYQSLLVQISNRLHYNRKQTYQKKLEYFQQICHDENSDLFGLFNLETLYQDSMIIRNNSNRIERMLLNAVYSYLFEYELDDRFIFSKRSRTPVQYNELRTLAALRNDETSIKEFRKNYEIYTAEEFCCTADYLILQVMEVFKTFVKDPSYIDNLILIHKYCCDTWKNGSKYLHFYTLHNQEHAVTLIRLVVRWIHAVSYFKLKKIDYYILFSACYLHDISMVSLPDAEDFYLNESEASNSIETKFIEQYELNNSMATKRALYNAYQSMEAFFENDIRNKHAENSADEIRKFEELNFIEPTVREFIAQASAAHGYNTVDIYGVKSHGQERLVNEKIIKILLRLCDLLDMSRYRISNVVLNHNMARLNETSRFHWISHLITDSCHIEAKYIVGDNDIGLSDGDSYLGKGRIIEKLILTVGVLMEQTTATKKSFCNYVKNSELSFDSGNRSDNQAIIKITCDRGYQCEGDTCNFLCKWFVTKNYYLLEELSALKEYLNSISENYFTSEVEIVIKVCANTYIPNEVFDYLRSYIEDDN